jgi:hypothetical protein
MISHKCLFNEETMNKIGACMSIRVDYNTEYFSDVYVPRKVINFFRNIGDGTYMNNGERVKFKGKMTFVYIEKTLTVYDHPKSGKSIEILKANFIDDKEDSGKRFTESLLLCITDPVEYEKKVLVWRNAKKDIKKMSVIQQRIHLFQQKIDEKQVKQNLSLHRIEI